MNVSNDQYYRDVLGYSIQFTVQNHDGNKSTYDDIRLHGLPQVSLDNLTPFRKYFARVLVLTHFGISRQTDSFVFVSKSSGKISVLLVLYYNHGLLLRYYLLILTQSSNLDPIISVIIHIVMNKYWCVFVFWLHFLYFKILSRIFLDTSKKFHANNILVKNLTKRL